MCKRALAGSLVLPDRVVENGLVVFENGRIVYAGRVRRLSRRCNG